MEKIIVWFLLALFCVTATGCADTKNIDGVTYDTYGLLSKDEKRNDAIQYELVWGNIVWGAILCETVIAPIYFFGFAIWEPTGKKTVVAGQVAR